jgi:hypothetical protein
MGKVWLGNSGWEKGENGRGRVMGGRRPREINPHLPTITRNWLRLRSSDEYEFWALSCRKMISKKFLFG